MDWSGWLWEWDLCLAVWFCRESARKRVRVNKSTEGNQDRPYISELEGGGFAVVWQASVFGGANAFGQLYDGSGRKTGKEFSIHRSSVTYQLRPSVTGLNGGGFVVTWMNYTGSMHSIFGQRFTPRWRHVGPQFPVAGESNGSYRGFRLSNGGFVITWVIDTDYYAQPYNSDGATIGSSFKINIGNTNCGCDPSSFGELSNGDTVFTWSSSNPDPDIVLDVRGQIYNPAWEPIGGEFKVNTEEAGNFGSSAAALRDGGFIVTWPPYVDAFTTSDIYGQRFDGQSLLAHFPLADRDPSTAEVTSVFDHSMARADTDGRFLYGHADKTVTAFTGNFGKRRFGVDAGGRGYKQAGGLIFSLPGMELRW